MGWLVEELDRLLARARREERAAFAAVRYRATLAQVEAYLEEHPGASANAAHREIGGRRQDVLRAVREVRARFPAAGNRS